MNIIIIIKVKRQYKKIFTCISVPPFAGCKAAPAPATSAAPALLEMACAACSAACADADCKNITYK